MGIEAQIEGYAFGKLSELVESLFCDVRPAREKLLEHYPTLFIIGGCQRTCRVTSCALL
ncbi:hypothetical protein [Paraburkholderia tuberum]|uniref:Uncharacterized protein n=1 Tax=Paraburkholderia tuberum TaxID=157910 RepID=A0A1H1G9H2_9BURK|nr:hypothetical protein [Paraburkholderia tuberum]SDR09840.1 hypothetical protein SAMN05445850_2782 [Paraburkholderia tuberum]